MIMKHALTHSLSSAYRRAWQRWGVLSVVLPIALALLIVTSVSAAAIISATKTDTFVGTHDGDGQADPGETIQYDVVINNTGTVPGTDDATGVTFNDTINRHHPGVRFD